MRHFKKIIRNIFAVICLIIGFIGGFIPILQGGGFVLLGFILLDFKKKEVYEEKVLNFLSKTKIGKKFVDLWKNIKTRNKDVMQNGDKKIKDIYKDLKKKT